MRKMPPFFEAKPMVFGSHFWENTKEKTFSNYRSDFFKLMAPTFEKKHSIIIQMGFAVAGSVVPHFSVNSRHGQ